MGASLNQPVTISNASDYAISNASDYAISNASDYDYSDYAPPITTGYASVEQNAKKVTSAFLA